MSLKQEVLQALKESEQYISGQALSEQLDVSRTAIWKAINSLRVMGYEIDSVTNKGYRLTRQEENYNQEELELACQTAWAGRELIFQETMTSTNLEMALLAEEKPHGFLMVADEQTAGRGRRGRTWISGKKGNIYASLLCKPTFEPNVASMLTLVMALAVTRGIEQILQVEAQIKWPNDILLNGKKICGILTEMRAEPDVIHHVILGIGINVNQDCFDEDVLPYATSLKRELGESVNRCSLLGCILAEFEALYAIFCETSDLSQLVEEYHHKLVNIGKSVRILSVKEEYEAIAQGIDLQGALMVETEDGEKHMISSGEVSVRGLYGYV